MSITYPAHVVRLTEPRVSGPDVFFRWHVEPETELYRRTSFRISFPTELDIESVPRALWWRIMLLCLHGHFALLRPCRIELPVKLGPSEGEFWLRLIDNVAAHLEAYGSLPRPGRAAEIIDSGPRSVPVRLPIAPDRAAVSFSGGKDSMVLAALAAELTERPMLVSTTSPVPWARDHVGAARERALAEIANRLPVELIEVQSDFRTSWELAFSTRDGCRFGVHELSDLPLYQGVTAAVAAASGIGRTLMASEADLQYNTRLNGTTIVQREFPSCAVTQGALDALLRQFGLRQGSLTYPLHMPQVQALLLRRYDHLADLQFSCWQAPPGEQACSACLKCLQIALVTLDHQRSPRAVGIDPVRALCAHRDWRLDTPPDHLELKLSEYRAPRHHIVHALQRTPTEQVRSILAADACPPYEQRLGEALAVYARMRAEALALTVPPEPGYVTDFLDFVHNDVRRPLRAILAEHFSPTSEPEFAAMAKRLRKLTSWIAAPLESARVGRLRRRMRRRRR